MGEFGIFAVGGEHYVNSAFEGCGGDYVPDVGFDCVGGYEVYLILGVGDAVVGYVAFVGASAFVFCALDLDAEEVAIVFDGEVVAGHVSPGLGDAESVLGGAGHETQFGPLAPELGVLDVDTLVGHRFFKSKAADRNVRPTKKKRPWIGAALFSYLLCLNYITWQWVIPPKFGIYICMDCMELAEIGWFLALDKNFLGSGIEPHLIELGGE